MELGRQLAFSRSLSGKIGVTVDQRALALVRGLTDGVRHYPIERRDAYEWPRRIGLVRNPRRKLHHLADRRGEGIAVGGIEGVERNRFHAND